MTTVGLILMLVVLMFAIPLWWHLKGEQSRRDADMSAATKNLAEYRGTRWQR